MPKILITASFQNFENRDEVEHLCALVRNAGFEDRNFFRDVEHYQTTFHEPRDLMNSALEEIRQVDYLLIDMTDKPTGRAIEAGIAFALGKKIIVIMKRKTKIKDTTRGIAEEIIEYENIDEITEKLKNVLSRHAQMV